MAEGPWVPAFASLWRGPKAARLASYRLGTARHAAGGMFLELMAWAVDACESGDLGRVPPAVLAEAVGLGGGGRSREELGARLLEALKGSGFVTNDERAHVVGWEDGPGKLIARRRYERERKAASRQRERGPGEDVSRGTGSGQPGSSQGLAPSQLWAGLDLSARTGESEVAPVPRDTPRIGAGMRAPSPDLSHGRPTGQGEPVPVQSREEKIYTPPTPPGTAAARGERPPGGKANGGEPLDPVTHASVLVEMAPEPWRTALEAFRERHGSGGLVTWFAGSVYEAGPTGATLTVLNDFAADFIGTKLRTELEASLGAPLTVRARRRPMGEPEVVR